MYLQPLVEELQSLWHGVLGYDVFKHMGSRNFILIGILLWTIHDFPSYNTMAGVAHQGYVACPICEPNFKGEHYVELGKHIYTKTRRWLIEGHPYRLARMKNHFDGQIETRSKPINVIVEE